MMRSSRLYRWMALASLLLLGLMIALPMWRVLPLAAEQPFVPLHYNIYLGVDRFGSVREIFFIPAFGVLCFVLNVGLQTYFYKREKLLTRFFAIATSVFQFILLVATALIVLIIV